MPPLRAAPAPRQGMQGAEGVPAQQRVLDSSARRGVDRQGAAAGAASSMYAAIESEEPDPRGEIIGASKHKPVSERRRANRKTGDDSPLPHASDDMHRRSCTYLLSMPTNAHNPQNLPVP